MANDVRIPDALRGRGNPLQVHPPRAAAGRAGYFTIGAILLILSAVTIIAIVNPPQHNPPPPIVFISLMGGFFVLSVVFFAVGMFSESYTLVLFPDALARVGAGAPETFRWSDVRDLYTYVNPVAAKYRLVAQDGRKLQIDNSVKDGKKLGESVQQALYDYMLPAALEAFAQGKTLTFGPLRIDQLFLYYKDKRLAWDEVAKMQLLYNAYTRSVHFEVKAGRSALLPWCSAKIQDIPNVDVFRALAERMKPFSK